METKEQLVGLIKDWIECDNRINEVQRMAKEHKENKKRLTLQLVQVMKDHEIDCFDINNGKLVYTKTKTKQSISKKVLLESLKHYFKEDPEVAEEVTNHVMNSRGEKVVESIKKKTAN